MVEDGELSDYEGALLPFGFSRADLPLRNQTRTRSMVPYGGPRRRPMDLLITRSSETRIDQTTVWTPRLRNPGLVITKAVLGHRSFGVMPSSAHASPVYDPPLHRRKSE